MLNFAEQTGSGAVIVVWSFVSAASKVYILIKLLAGVYVHKVPYQQVR